MGWHQVTKTYDIDLSLPESRRWQHVIENEIVAARRLVREALADFEEALSHRPWLAAALKWAAGKAYRWGRRLYAGEIGAWADALRMKFHDMLMLQFIYELTHVAEWYAYKHATGAALTPMGCTAGLLFSQDGTRHVRNMDWPLLRIGQATRLFRFRRGDHQFISVGMLGYVGVISGMVPGRYSVTMNWAPPTRYPRLSTATSFLLRETLTHHDSYYAARDELLRAPISTNALFALCGVSNEQRTVVERCVGPKVEHAALLEATGAEPLGVANHYQAIDANALIAAEPDVYTDSLERQVRMEDALQNHLELEHDLGPGLRRVCKAFPVFNDQTCQSMIFDPAKGEVRAWAER